MLEAKLKRQTIRRTIGDVRAWSIETARNEANRLRVTLDAGTDPREVERQQKAAKAAAAHAVTVGEAWAAREARDRSARVRLALRLLKAFLRWAASEPDLKGKADPTAASAKKAREVAGKAKPKNDYIQREQLPTWFTHVRQIQNPVIAAYLQCLLLTGARREELAELKWEDVNFQWRGMELKDKIEGRRAVPLTPFVSHLLAALPRRNEWVFPVFQPQKTTRQT